MKKFLTVLCLALLLTLVCASAMALDGKYYSNGKQLVTLTSYNGEAITTPGKQITIIQEPKCKAGVARIVTDAGNKYDVPVDAVHNLVLKNLDGSEASCQSSGYAQYVCADCGAVDPTNAGLVTLEAKAHKYDKVVVDIAETCSHGGKTHNVCIWCGKPEPISNTNPDIKYTLTPKHDPVWASNYVIEVEKTCKDKGLRYRVCQLCGEPEVDGTGKVIYDDKYNVLGDHTWGEYIVKTPATCQDGLEARYCSVCNKEDTRIILAKDGHTYEAVIKSVLKCSAKSGVAEAATDADVVVVKRCATCGTEVPGTVADLSASQKYANHTFVPDPSGVNIPPECGAGGANGQQALKCTVCGGTYTKVIPALTQHNWGEWVLVVAPGTDGTKNGVWERHCTNYHCIEKETYVGVTAPKGAAPVPTATANATTAPTTAPTGAPSGSENYQVTSWSFTGSGVSGQVKGNVTYRTPGLGVNVIIYTPTGTFLATSTPVNEDGTFSVSAGGAVYAVSIQLKDNTKTYQTDGKYV